jgi:hypothetical protein
MGATRSIIRGLVIGVAAVAVGLVAGPAFAEAGGTGHTVTMTQHQHGTFEDDGATNPCTGAPAIGLGLRVAQRAEAFARFGAPVACPGTLRLSLSRRVRAVRLYAPEPKAGAA